MGALTKRSRIGLRRPSLFNMIAMLLGAGVALIAWWLLDDVASDVTQRFARAERFLGPLVQLGLISAIATLLLIRSRVALLTAVVVNIVLIILGGYGSGKALITIGDNDLQFTLLRGAHSPVTFVLTAAWIAIAIGRTSRFASLGRRKLRIG